jgi:hypothetical protein
MGPSFQPDYNRYRSLFHDRSAQPSTQPSTQPSAHPSEHPSAQPSSAPSSSKSEYQYLQWVIVLTFFWYFSILAIYKYYNSYICIIDDDRDESTNTEVETQFKFEDTFESYIPGLTYVLFFFRFFSFTYIAGVPIISKAQNLMFIILYCFCLVLTDLC